MKRKGNFNGRSFKAKKKYSPPSRVPAAVAMEVSRQLTRIGEMKSIDIPATSTVINTVGAVTLLNGVARGDTSATRVGNRITLRSIQVKGYGLPTAATGNSQCGRVIVVYDRQSNGAAPAVTDILKDSHGSSLKNQLNDGRFLTLMDQMLAIPTADGNGEYPVLVDFYKKLNLSVDFNANNAGTIADFISGSIYLLSIGSEAAGAGAGAFVFSSRVRFNDL